MAPPRLVLRPLSGWEEELVERHDTEPNTARLCNEVLARCMVAPGEDPGDARAVVRRLLVAERDRELVALRRLSLGPEISAELRCPTCGVMNQAEFSTDVLPLDFPDPEQSVVVAVDGVGDAILHLPTAGDQEELLDAELDGDAERRTWLLARCLDRYGKRSDGLDIGFARGLPVAQRHGLESAIEAQLPDLALQMAVDCWSCNEHIVAPFDVPGFFLLS